MPSQRLLVLKDVFNYGDNTGDARVAVDEQRVLITPHDSADTIVLDFGRDQWLELVEFVRWNWQPPTMAGRE